MNWWQTLLDFDRSVFHWINSGWSNGFFDVMLPLCRERLFWAPLYLFIVSVAVINFGKQARWVVLGLLLTVAASDFTSSTLIKKNVRRVRPCNDPALSEMVVERVHCGGGYSFTSSHATNHFAVAFFLIGVFGGCGRWVRPALVLWAGTIAISQVYVGVHFPADVAVGALLGALIGWSMYRLGKKLKVLPIGNGRRPGAPIRQAG